MTLKLKKWDTAEHLKTEEDIARYWEACLEEGGDDAAFITAALGTIARTRGMSNLARETGLTREGLYKALSPDGNPEFSTVMKAARRRDRRAGGALDGEQLEVGRPSPVPTPRWPSGWGLDGELGPSSARPSSKRRQRSPASHAPRRPHCGSSGGDALLGNDRPGGGALAGRELGFPSTSSWPRGGRPVRRT